MSHDDCLHWGLTRTQCAHYHARICHYWADRAIHHADEAARFSRKAHHLGIAGLLMWLLVLVSMVLL